MTGGTPWDFVRLFVGIPVLVASLVIYLRGSLRGTVVFIGSLASFLYQYLLWTFDWAYNAYFLGYVGVFALTKAIYPLITSSRHGRIVVVGSRTALMGNPGMSGYVESKAAAMGFVRVLAREAGEHAITVNAVAPGMIATPGTRANSDEAAFDRMVGIQAIKRRVTPEHVAALVAFLASDDAEMITGQTIVCDGGGYLH